MRAKKLPSGNYRAMASKTVNGERIRKSFTAPTKNEAELLAVAWVARGKEQEELPTVGEILDKYIEHREAILSPSTIYGYIKLCPHIKKRFGRIVASDMTSEMLQTYANELALDHAPKTVKNYMNLLIAALNSAMPDIKYHVKYPKREPLTYNIPDDEALNALISHSKGDMRLCIILGAKGLRRGEICALKYKDVLRDLHSVYVHADMVKDKNGKWILKPIPKTEKSIRRVELPPEIIDMIPDGDPEEFIIKHPPSYVTDRFCELRNSLGLSCRFHDLRHFSVSLNHAIGIPDQYNQEMHGFSTDHTMKRVYRNSMKEKSVRFAKKSNDEFLKVIKKSI